MKKVILSIILLMLTALSFSQPVFAVNIFQSCTNGVLAGKHTGVCSAVATQQKNGNPDPILAALKTTIDVISYIIGVAAVIVLIIAGLEMIIGGGDAQSVATARNSIIYALVGIVVAVLAQSIVVFVLKNVA
jgi:hypothetical protein